MLNEFEWIEIRGIEHFVGRSVLSIRSVFNTIILKNRLKEEHNRWTGLV
jgi:hypothetical protein